MPPDPAVGEIVQFLFADAVDPLVAVHPQETVVVLQDLKRHVAVQPVPGGDGAEPAVLEADQAAAVGADPQGAVVVGMDRPDGVLRGSLALGWKVVILPLAEAVQVAVVGPHPDGALAVLGDGVDEIVAPGRCAG